MNIAVIGTGNVGGGLAISLANAGHHIFLGVRNPLKPRVQELLNCSDRIEALSVNQATQEAQVVILAAHPPATRDIVDNMGALGDRIIVDTMNSVFNKAEPYANTSEALVEWTESRRVVKCFNTTGYENLERPVIDGVAADMFLAGDDSLAKEVVSGLAKDIGFAEVYDFGKADKFDLLEKLALCWINLAINQEYGRRLVFKIIREQG